MEAKKYAIIAAATVWFLSLANYAMWIRERIIREWDEKVVQLRHEIRNQLNKQLYGQKNAKSTAQAILRPHKH